MDVSHADAAAEPPLDTGDRQLDPRFIPHQRLIGRLVAAGVGIGLVAVASGASVDAWPSLILVALIWVGWLTAVALLAWWGERWPAIEYRHTTYRVDAGGIEIRRGVVFRRVINVPRTRIQHTDVSQGPLERRFGLGSLIVHTAGTSYARVELSGLEHGLALRIRDFLLPRDTHDAV